MCLPTFLLCDRGFSAVLIRPCLLMCVRAFDKDGLSAAAEGKPPSPPRAQLDSPTSPSRPPPTARTAFMKFLKHERRSPRCSGTEEQDGGGKKRETEKNIHTNIANWLTDWHKSEPNLFKINSPDFSVVKEHQMHYSSIWASLARSALSHILRD